MLLQILWCFYTGQQEPHILNHATLQWQMGQLHSRRTPHSAIVVWWFYASERTCNICGVQLKWLNVKSIDWSHEHLLRAYMGPWGQCKYGRW